MLFRQAVAPGETDQGWRQEFSDRSSLDDQPLRRSSLRRLLYQPGRMRDGEAMPASSTARMPVRKMPSKVPAPPIEATGAPRPLILSRLSRSAPTSVPIEPPI